MKTVLRSGLTTLCIAFLLSSCTASTTYKTITACVIGGTAISCGYVTAPNCGPSGSAECVNPAHPVWACIDHSQCPVCQAGSTCTAGNAQCVNGRCLMQLP